MLFPLCSLSPFPSFSRWKDIYYPIYEYIFFKKDNTLTKTMSSLSDVPPEILIAVGERFPALGDWAALAAADRRMYAIVNPMLYEQMARTYGKRGLFWGASTGQAQTVRKSLEAGADPCWRWPSSQRAAVRTARTRRNTREPAAVRIPNGVPIDGLVGDIDVPSEDESGDDGESGEDDAYTEWGHAPESGDWPDYLIAEHPINWDLFLRSFPYSWTALHIAASRGHDDVVSVILEYGDGGELNHPTAAPRPVEMGARGVCRCRPPRALRGNEDLLLGDADVDWKPLHHAICRGHISTAKLLLSGGAPIYTDGRIEEGGRGITALHTACQHGLLPLVKFIVENGHQTNLDEPDSAGQTPLVYAFLYRRWACFEWLLEQGADINYPTRRQGGAGSMLNDACQSADDFELACRLLDLGLSVEYERTHDDANPFPSILQKPWDKYVPCKGPGARKAEDENRARRTYGARLMTKLLEKGCPTDCLDPVSGLTPLALAIHHNIMPAVRILLDAGADVNACGARNVTPLHEACRFHRDRNPELVAQLLERGAAVDKADEHGQTPLYLACEACAVGPKVVEIVQLLVDRGADPLRRCPYKDTVMTPLLWASQHVKLASFELLLSRSSAVATGGRRVPAADISRAFSNSVNRIGETCLRLLLDLDDENVVARTPQSLYQLTCGRACSPGAVRLLLDRGASCTYVTSPHGGGAGETAIMNAVERKLGLDIVERLLDGGADPNFVDPLARVPLLAAYRGEPDGYAYGRLLLRRGADAHKLLPPDPVPLTQTMVSTPLTRAIRDHGKGGSSGEAVRAMLEHQPFRDRPTAPWRPTLVAAVEAGNGPALRALIASGIDTRFLRADPDRPLLHLLGSVREWMDRGTGKTRVEVVDDWVDAVLVLVEMGARWSARDKRGESAAAKADHLVWRRSQEPRVVGISHCIAQRIRLSTRAHAQPDVNVSPERVGSIYGCDTVDAVGKHLLEERQAAAQLCIIDESGQPDLL